MQHGHTCLARAVGTRDDIVMVSLRIIPTRVFIQDWGTGRVEEFRKLLFTWGRVAQLLSQRGWRVPKPSAGGDSQQRDLVQEANMTEDPNQSVNLYEALRAACSEQALLNRSLMSWLITIYTVPRT